MAHCPQSDTPGKRVSQVTLNSLLLVEHRSRIEPAAEWSYCPDPDCEVVYFDAEGSTLSKSALSVRVGAKESDPPRPICYCFGHSFEEIEAEVAATGTSKIPDNITEKCRQGLHDCERKNPQGSCCLGVVRAALKEAQASGSRSAVTDEEGCCPSPSQSPERPSTGRLAAGGAIVSAILSSACCWLPLTLLAFGASAAGVSGFFERYRPLFLGASAVMLGLGFYLVYFREPACAPGEACAVPNPRLTRVNKVMLWIAAAFVAAFALFPSYDGTLIGTSHRGEVTSEATYDLEFAVESMTCEACAITLGSHLASLPGVSTAEVEYTSKKARLRFASPQTRPSDQAIAETVSAAGYRAVLP
jgi:copper chaperone CopZ